jgi:putative ABC transport system permease protein
VVVGLALMAAGRGLVAAVAPLARSSRFALRHAVVSLRRPNNQTQVILLSVGLGCFFILAVRALQENLLFEFTRQVGERAPDFVLIDIQSDQAAGVGAAISPFLRQPPRLLPMMRARVVGVEGRRVTLATADDVRQQGALTREYGLTFRGSLQDNEAVTAGAFWDGPLASPSDGFDTEVSVEAEEAARGRLGVGDTMRFDIGGRVVRARVTSLRSVSWDQTENGGFVFVLRPSPAVERLAHTYVGFVELGADPASRFEMQRALVRGYPNVSAIDVRDVLASIKDIVANVTLAVTIVGAVMLIGGILVLVGAVAMTKFQRVYEAAIYRTLGAGTRRLAAMAAIEYGLLGLLAGVLGAVGALGLSWALATSLLDIAWRPAPGLLAAGVVITAATVSVVGLVASVEVLVRKPLGTLRGG